MLKASLKNTKTCILNCSWLLNVRFNSKVYYIINLPNTSTTEKKNAFMKYCNIDLVQTWNNGKNKLFFVFKNLCSHVLSNINKTAYEFYVLYWHFIILKMICLYICSLWVSELKVVANTANIANWEFCWNIYAERKKVAPWNEALEVQFFSIYNVHWRNHQLFEPKFCLLSIWKREALINEKEEIHLRSFYQPLRIR